MVGVLVKEGQMQGGWTAVGRLVGGGGIRAPGWMGRGGDRDAMG